MSISFNHLAEIIKSGKISENLFSIEFTTAKLLYFFLKSAILSEISTLAKLSGTVPMPFAGTETFVFTMDGEAVIVGEGGNKPAGEANISLYWYKKISIEELIINGNCTFFDSRDFTRHVYNGILLFDNRNFIRDKTGETKNGSLDIQKA